MSDLVTNEPVAGPVAAALALLREAELAAEGARTEADRYARQREREADLLVAKARRVLVAAEEKAAVIVATARSEARELIDLDALAEGEQDGIGGSRFEGLLASAISNAVDDAFSPDRD